MVRKLVDRWQPKHAYTFSLSFLSSYDSMQAITNRNFVVEDWGMIDYKTAWEKQEALFQETVRIKENNRSLDSDKCQYTPNYLIFCEHRPVYTLGKTGTKAHLLLPEATLASKEIALLPINRGGDITYHGPGQLVLYPVLDLDNFFHDVHLYLRILERAVMHTLQKFQLSSGVLPGFTGVWLDATDPEKARKICAIGIRLSKWVTMHGLALNVNTDLSYFQHIIPCGLQGSKVTSMEAELGYTVSMEAVKTALKQNIMQCFALS